MKASSGVDDTRRPLLILKAAAQLAALDRDAAQLVWSNAIKDFNRFDDHQYSNIEWNRTIRLGALSLSFPLLGTNVDMSFERSFSVVLSADFDAGIPRATELRNENLRARGFVEIVAAQINKTEKPEINTITKTN